MPRFKISIAAFVQIMPTSPERPGRAGQPYNRLVQQAESSVENREKDCEMGGGCFSSNRNRHRRSTEPDICSNQHRQSPFGSGLATEASAIETK
jgi:hypothetical protein